MPPGPHSGFKEDVFYASFMKGYSFRFYGGGSGASSIGLFFMDIYDIDRKCAVAIPDYFAFFKRERPIDAQTPLDGTGDQPMATIEDLFETRIRQPNGFAPEKFAVAEGDRGYVLDKRQTGWVREFMVPMRAGHADKPTSSPH
jgi:hypothetical protein